MKDARDLLITDALEQCIENERQIAVYRKIIVALLAVIVLLLFVIVGGFA